MKKALLAASLFFAFAGAPIIESAQAAAIAPGGFRTAAEQFSVVDKVQFVWRGKRYCWYNSGWRGPGWYQCGFRWRRGRGWGGPSGWHGWRRPGLRPPVHRPGVRPPLQRPTPPIGTLPGGNRPGGNRPDGNRPGGTRPGGTSGNL